MGVLDNYKKIQENIAASAARVKRSPAEITLVAVTKTASPEQVKHLIEAGHRDLAESRVLQLQQRAAQIAEWLARQAGKNDKKLPAPEEIIWHMIGHLQRNKVKPVLLISSIIHSCDSLRLAEEIQAAAGKSEKTTRILLEVNVSGESTKFGVAVGAALHLAEQIDTMEGVQIIGLMTMAPHSENPEKARPYFVRLREIFEEIRFKKIGGAHFQHLSMGMSGDYQVAIEEGATMVRVGTALFE
jgi:pyridoxal phosphate enzyme (YggS family)